MYEKETLAFPNNTSDLSSGLESLAAEDANPHRLNYCISYLPTRSWWIFCVFFFLARLVLAISLHTGAHCSSKCQVAFNLSIFAASNSSLADGYISWCEYLITLAWLLQPMLNSLCKTFIILSQLRLNLHKSQYYCQRQCRYIPRFLNICQPLFFVLVPWQYFTVKV